MNTEKRFPTLLISAIALVFILACLPLPFNPDAPTPQPPATDAPTSVPDLIYHNGVLLTMEQDHPLAQAIAILGDEILAVGSDEEILALQEPDTLVVDLGGQTLLPGFISGHTHVMWGPAEAENPVEVAQEVALRHGFTTVTEMTSENAHLNPLLQAEADSRLRLRVNVFPSYNLGRLDENGEIILSQTWYPGNDPILDPERMLRIPGIKVFVDGAYGVRGCPAMREPYDEEQQSQDWFLVSCGSEYGDLYWEQGELNQVVADAQAAGYRVAFHAMGDKAIEVTINAIEFALDGQPNSMIRHQIQHVSFLEPDLLERFLQLDLLASVRGHFNTCDQDEYHNHSASNRYALPGLGAHAYLEVEGGWGTDPEDKTRSTTINSLVQLWGLVTRQQLLADGTTCTPDPWLAQHVITVEQALRMITYEPAYAVSMEDYIGSLEAGKFADLIILSGNPVTVDPNSLKDLEVWMTMVGGRVEYCAPGHETVCPGWQPPSASTDEPDESPTENPVEPVTIKLKRDVEERIPAGTPVQLTIGWAADTEEQVADFLVAVSLTGTLDGGGLTDLNDYWGEIEPREGGNYGTQGEDYQSTWLYPLGVLSAGTHTVDVRGTLETPVTDGIDSNNDGQLDEYSGEIWQFSLRIFVEE